MITFGIAVPRPAGRAPLVVWASAVALATAGTLRVPGILRWSCGVSGCCAHFDRDLAEPLPAEVGLLSIYSREDGMVDWRA